MSWKYKKNTEHIWKVSNADPELWLNYKGPKHQSEVPTVGSGGGGVPELDPCSFSTSTWPLPLSSTGILMSPYPPPMQKEKKLKNVAWKNIQLLNCLEITDESDHSEKK